MSDDIRLTSLVHQSVSGANDFVKVFDHLLGGSGDAFSIERGTLESLRSVLSTNALLTAKLFEENQQIREMLQKLATKPPTTSP